MRKPGSQNQWIKAKRKNKQIVWIQEVFGGVWVKVGFCVQNIQYYKPGTHRAGSLCVEVVLRLVQKTRTGFQNLFPNNFRVNPDKITG